MSERASLRAGRRGRGADDRPARAAQRVDAADRRGACAQGLRDFEADDGRPRARPHRRRRRGLLRRRRPEGDGPRRRPSRRADGADPADPVEAGDRRGRRLVPGRRASSWRSGATCGSPPRGSTFGLFERRWGVPLVDGGTQRLPRVVGMGRALELILTGRPVEAEEAHADRPRQRGRRARHATSSARSSWPSGSPPSRRRRCSPTAAPRSRASACRSPRGSPSSTELGREVLDVAARGAARFAAGEGRHGEGV